MTLNLLRCSRVTTGICYFFLTDKGNGCGEDVGAAGVNSNTTPLPFPPP
jgi:hypothetical protein